MKKIFTCIVFLFAVSAFAQLGQQELLQEAYRKKSGKLLKEFFERWHDEIPSVKTSELNKLNDTLVQAYKVFTEFYNPLDLKRIGGSEWGGDVYKKCDYLIVQNAVKIYFKDTVYYATERKINYLEPEELVLTDSIMDFRPIVNCCDDKTPVYLTKEYYNLLSAFLGNESVPLGTGGLMNPSRSEGESKKRKKFLERQIVIWYGHWGGYWQLISYPEADAVIFDKEMKYARVDFRMVYQGGEAFFKNENGKWIFISGKLTWIE